MIIMFSVALVLVQIAQSDAPLHNLHAEQHKYEQCSILLVGMNNYAMHNNHIMHIFFCYFGLSFPMAKSSGILLILNYQGWVSFRGAGCFMDLCIYFTCILFINFLS